MRSSLLAVVNLRKEGLCAENVPVTLLRMEVNMSGRSVEAIMA